MSKYYVQSGTMRQVIQARSSQKAAIWAVHQAMQQVLPVDDGTDRTPESKSAAAGQQGVAVLAGRVTVSERGFDRDDATDFATFEVVHQWHELVSTLDRLEQMVRHAA